MGETREGPCEFVWLDGLARHVCIKPVGHAEPHRCGDCDATHVAAPPSRGTAEPETT